MTLNSSLYLITQPIRWRILQVLINSEEGMTPTLISSLLQIELDTISHHLVRLRDEGLVLYVPSGHSNIYFPNRSELSRIGKETQKALHKEIK